MASVTMPPTEEARAIFNRLGYTVSGDGTELLAERKWRTVRVCAVADCETVGRQALTDGGHADEHKLQCFVTWKEYTEDLRERLLRSDPTYEWAIIGVGDGDDYDVLRAPEKVAA